jgi:hypothetical protein
MQKDYLVKLWHGYLMATGQSKMSLEAKKKTREEATENFFFWIRPDTHSRGKPTSFYKSIDFLLGYYC